MAVNFVDVIPKEVSLLIFEKCDVSSLASCAATSKSWHSLLQDSWLWSRLFKREFGAGAALPRRISDEERTRNWKAMYKLEHRWQVGEFRKIHHDFGVQVNAILFHHDIVFVAIGRQLSTFLVKDTLVRVDSISFDYDVTCLQLDNSLSYSFEDSWINKINQRIFIGCDNGSWSIASFSQSGKLEITRGQELSIGSIQCATLQDDILVICSQGIYITFYSLSENDCRRLHRFHSKMSFPPLQMCLTDSTLLQIAYSIPMLNGYTVGLQKFELEGDDVVNSTTHLPSPMQGLVSLEPSFRTFSKAACINSLRFDPTSGLLVVGFRDNTLRIFQVSDSTLIPKSLSHHHTASVEYIAMDMERAPGKMVSAGADGKLNVWWLTSQNNFCLSLLVSLPSPNRELPHRWIGFDEEQIVCLQGQGNLTIYNFI